jgi:hypothetical protein
MAADTVIRVPATSVSQTTGAGAGVAFHPFAAIMG